MEKKYLQQYILIKNKEDIKENSYAVKNFHSIGVF